MTLRTSRRLKTGTDYAISNKQSFHNEARSQHKCAVCGEEKAPWQAHHVVAKSLLKREGKPQYDTRNALRVCRMGVGKNCHGRHEHSVRKIRTSELTQDNIDYAFYLLGAYAFDYLSAHYDVDDERLDEGLAEALAMP